METIINGLAKSRTLGGTSLHLPSGTNDTQTNALRAGILRLVTKEAAGFCAEKAEHWRIEYGISFCGNPKDERAPQIHWSLYGYAEGQYQMRLFFPDPFPAPDLPEWRRNITIETEYSEADLAQSGLWAACDHSGLTDHLAGQQNQRQARMLEILRRFLAQHTTPQA